MARILQSLVKKIGLSSNQLLKCVLMNTAIELFSYTDAPAYSTSCYLYYDWSMEDHLYRAPSDAEQTLETADLPLDWILDQADLTENPSVPEDSVCITSVDQLDTMYLPIPEDLCAQATEVNDKLDFNRSNLCKPESFYYLTGPVNLWLEFPVALDTQVAQTPPSTANPHYTEDDFHCFGKYLSFLNASPRLSSGTKRQDVVFRSCGVQTTEDLLIPSANDNLKNESFSVSFNCETKAMESIFWDSYDLHLPTSLMECVDTNEWEPTDPDMSIVDHLFKLVRTELPAEQPVSSTPMRLVQSKGKVHILEGIKHMLFD